jgi:uncharacterized protein (DUF2141 family)
MRNRFNRARWLGLPLMLVMAGLPRAEKPTETEIEGDRASLTVLVTGIRSNEGKLRFALYRTRESFTNDPMLGGAETIEERRAEWRLSNLEPGPYAVAIYHDENNDDKFNMNFLGIPTEDYGFSNNVRARLGPPSWKRVVFEVNPGTNLHHIRIRGG